MLLENGPEKCNLSIILKEFKRTAEGKAYISRKVGFENKIQYVWNSILHETSVFIIRIGLWFEPSSLCQEKSRSGHELSISRKPTGILDISRQSFAISCQNYPQALIKVHFGCALPRSI
jgi:hypothetical protein